MVLLACFCAGTLHQRQERPASGNTAEEGRDSKSTGENGKADSDYIKWVEFRVTKDALQKAYEYDVDTYDTEHHVDWIELLACLGARYGGDFSNYQAIDMDDAAGRFISGDVTSPQLEKDMKYYSYYLKAYRAVLGGMVGEYEMEERESETPDTAGESKASSETAGTVQPRWVKKYGLKAYHPIAKGFPYSDYDDFGASRTYGYKRNHLGHDMMGQVGTPVIAVESGYVYHLGWNQYGGWRVGINSFDGKRYYYYAHLRKDFPFPKQLREGSIVQAGDVIGYIGRTGYSANENVNNIDIYHLHFGLQIIFDESQREGNNQIWVDVYPLVQFLYQNQSETVREDSTKEWSRILKIKDPEAEVRREVA